MNLAERDAKVIWHPYTQMKDAAFPVGIVRGEGAHLFDESGNKYIDAISSWWTNLHGHSHPYIAEKISEQLKTLDHVLFAGFTHEPAVQLAERLLTHLPSNQKKIFYSDNGSTAVEVAIKMSLQYWHNKGEKRNKIIALENAYHGDTFGAMSVSGRSIFTKPFDDLLFEVIHVPVSRNKESVAAFKSQISGLKSQICSFIFEPLVQGTAGMIMYEPEYLDEIISCCKKENILSIADEVMTGFGRTGKFFACDYLSQQPDIVCLSKGITGGTMALGVTSCSDKIYEAFLSEDKTKTLFHGHSYTANPVTCSAALASLDLLEQEDSWKNIDRINKQHLQFRNLISNRNGVRDCRMKGTILAVEFEVPPPPKGGMRQPSTSAAARMTESPSFGGVGEASGYLSSIRDNLYNYFLEQKIILRPLGNIVYIMPPYCISNEDLEIIYTSISEAIDKFAENSVTAHS